MSQLTREFDWSKTSVGHPGNWPQSLRTTVSNLLRSKFPMFLWWGNDMIQFYNDAYRPSLGNEGKHPTALGQKGPDCWPEIWDIISPLMRQVETSGEATWMENQLVPIFRNGKIEDVYWTYSYSSVLDDDGNHGGILVTCMETTEAVLSKKLLEDSQNRLQESEARFRNVIEQAPVAIGLTRGEDFVFESINPPMLQLINQKNKHDVLGKRLTEVLPELERQPVFDILKKVLQTGEMFNGTEIPAELAKEGVLQYRYFNITYNRVVDKDGIAFVLHMATDVTEQVLSRKQIEYSESKYRRLFEKMDQGFSIIEMIFDDDNKPVDSLFLEMNSVFEKQSGFKGAVGKRIREIVPDIEDKWFDVYGKVALTGEAMRFTDGSEVLGRWFEIYAFPAGEVGSRRVAVLFTDITERVVSRQKIEASQRSLLTLFEESPVGIATLSADDQLVFETANAFYGGLVGRTPEEIIGKPLLEALPEIKGQGFEELLKEVIASGKSFAADEAAVAIVRNGKLETIYVNLTYQPRKEGKKVIGILVVATDVTEQVRSRRKIEESETKFRSLIQEAPFATVLYTGPELTIDTINEAMLQLWDKPASVVGKTFEQALPELKGQPFADILKNVYRTGEEYVALEEPAEIMIHGHMRRGWYKFNYKPIRNEKGEVYGIVHMAVEVTEQVIARHQIEEVVAQRTKELAAANETLQQINKELQRSNAHLEEFARCRLT